MAEGCSRCLHGILSELSGPADVDHEMDRVGEGDDEDDGGEGRADAVDIESQPAHHAQGPEDCGGGTRGHDESGTQAAKEGESDDEGDERSEGGDGEEFVPHPRQGFHANGNAAGEAGLDGEAGEGLLGEFADGFVDWLQDGDGLRAKILEFDGDEESLAVFRYEVACYEGMPDGCLSRRFEFVGGCRGRREEGLAIGARDLRDAEHTVDALGLLRGATEFAKRTGEFGSEERIAVENENEAVVIGSELLEVLLEDGEIGITLLEDGAWFAVELETESAEESEEADDPKEDRKRPAVTKEEFAVSVSETEAGLVLVGALAQA